MTSHHHLLEIITWFIFTSVYTVDETSGVTKITYWFL